ncbi:ribosome maturation factor RimM [Vagococcus penaei]|uniref:Ribosome maturation factor RimM n=1 Tax=Vagococcus penaei TaxID=633807 RepID=A0A1Q2D3Q9_9ENTE|nr:ribosome maturation factor RimM [Vagococcus penaei]AQP53020.1 ribosome maturation factor RimM [Vagococcus penaei]RSU06120.1 ribosome maturation factor RimM [Vagococcus penaei]
MTDYLNVGKIVNTQGIKGEVRVISQTDFADERYKVGNTLYLFQDKKPMMPLTIKSHRKHKNFDILSFDNHPWINDVEHYRDGILKVAMTDLTELPANEFYYHEIIGANVFEEDGTHLGTIKEILSPGANDVWVIQQPAKNQKDILIPYIESVVLSVDAANQKVVVEIPEGLID